MAITGAAVCAGGKPRLKFTYSGDYVVRKDGVVELLTSGTLVLLEPALIDVFCVGGGGGGGYKSTINLGFGGGGGGYTRTIRRLSVPENTEIPITVGAGGAESTNSAVVGMGGTTQFGSYTVPGGNGGGHTEKHHDGGKGGSGGGGGVASNSDYGTGGADGNAGESGYPTSVSGGEGQGFTTREFGELSGKLYAGGGGGGRYIASQTPVISSGGSGGGGSGGWVGTTGQQYQPPAAGLANTGGGGGGGARGINSTANGASGGSGIVCFREAQELPELAGTWVLNERVYPPSQQIVETVSFTSLGVVTEVKQVRIGDGTNTGSGNMYIGISTTVTAPSYSTIYTYNTNTWGNIGSLSSAHWVFPAGSTASDEFRAWLASNATKQ